MSSFQGAIVLTRPAVEYGMWRHSEGACPPAQNFPRLIQAREIIFDAATFALLVYLTYRIDFLLKFQVSFNPDRPFKFVFFILFPYVCPYFYVKRRYDR